jgi:hypothetical protein
MPVKNSQSKTTRTTRTHTRTRAFVNALARSRAPVHKVEPASPPADATKPASPPADATKPASPPADATKPASPPADATKLVSEEDLKEQQKYNEALLIQRLLAECKAREQQWMDRYSSLMRSGTNPSELPKSVWVGTTGDV